MRRFIIIFLFIPMISFGQNNINYQAIVSNSSGSVISSQSIGVKLSVIYTNANSGAVYSETHTTTTTSSGLINIKLGSGGTASGTFANVDWSTSAIYLKSEVNIGSGYVNMGTQQIEAVPVALYAKNVSNININNNNTTIGINSMTTSPTSGQVNTAVGEKTLYSNSSGEGNTAIGYAALEDNTTGFTNVALGQNALKENTTASQNVAVGYAAMRSNVTNGSLTAVGAYSLSSVIANTYGLTAIGYKSLENNTTGWNTTALGHMSLNSNTTGADNLASGTYNSQYNTTGSANTSVGSHGLQNNTIGNDNTTLGYVTLKNNTQGDNNTAIGSRAGEDLNTNSNNNTFLGSGADTTSGTTLSNSTAIGSGAIVTASNKIRLGNTNVTSIEGQVAWTNASDRRLKKDITSTKYGLETILKLVPVDYLLKSNNLSQIGFIAQDLKPIVPEAVNGSEGDIEKGETLGITYTSIIPILTKAIQEQEKVIREQEVLNEKQKVNIDTLTKTIDSIIKRIDTLENK
jgi:hypothetical protein